MDKLSVSTIDDRRQPRTSQPQLTLALRSSVANRKVSKSPSKQLPPVIKLYIFFCKKIFYQGQFFQNILPTIFQRRDQIRIYEGSEDVTPRGLMHPDYHALEERITAFDKITQVIFKQSPSAGPIGQSTLSTQTSFTSIYTVDDLVVTKYSSQTSLGGSLRAASEKAIKPIEDDDETPTQFPLPK